MAKQHKPSFEISSARAIQSTGERPPDPQMIGSLLKHPPSPNFMLKVNPNRWGLLGNHLLPYLGSLKIDPGVGCVDKNGGTDLAESRARKNGWIILPQDIVAGGYVRRHKVAKGYLHCTIWEQPVQRGNLAINRRDEAGYQQFVMWLVESGICGYPEPEVLEAMDELVRDRLERLLESGRNERRINIVELEIQRIAEMQALVQGRSELPSWKGPQYTPGGVEPGIVEDEVETKDPDLGTELSKIEEELDKTLESKDPEPEASKGRSKKVTK